MVLAFAFAVTLLVTFFVTLCFLPPCVGAAAFALAVLFLLLFWPQLKMTSDVVATQPPCRAVQRIVEVTILFVDKLVVFFFHQKAICGQELGQIRCTQPAVVCKVLGIAGQEFGVIRLVRCQVTSPIEREGVAPHL